MRLLLVLSTLIPIVLSSDDCHEDNGDLLLKLVTGEEETTFDEYRAKCQKIGADLVFIKDQDKQDHVAMLLSHVEEGLYFLGAKRSNVSSEFEWLDGTPLNFTAWSGNANDNLHGNEDALAISVSKKNLNSFGWEDTSLTKEWEPLRTHWVRRGAICETLPKKKPCEMVQAASSPSANSETEKTDEDFHLKDNFGLQTPYIVIYRKKLTTFDEYRAECQKLCADLAMIKNQEQQEAISSFLHDKPEGWYFLGATKDSSGWKWLDGTPLDGFTSWRKGAPDHPSRENALAFALSKTKSFASGWEDVPAVIKRFPTYFLKKHPYWVKRGAVCAKKDE